MAVALFCYVYFNGVDMPEITALQIQARRRDRVSVFIDGAYAFSLQSILAAELHLGQALTEQEIAALKRRDQVEWTYERTLNFLSYRPRSEAEVRRYLAKREVEDEAATEVVDRLRRMNLVNDDDFVRFWVENRMTFRPRGAWALRAELRQKGVDAALIERELEDLDEAAGARQAAERVVGRYEALDRETFVRRMMGHLQRRGFGYAVCRDLVAELWREIEARRGEDPQDWDSPDDQ